MDKAETAPNLMWFGRGAGARRNLRDGTSRVIIEEGRTCWRVAAAKRAAVLVDGSSYFAAAREAMLKARESIFIVGWDIHGETDLLPGVEASGDGAPTKLRAFINHVVQERGDLRVRILLWDFAALYVFEREFLPFLNWRLRTPPQVEICFDDKLPLGGSHHQKLLVVDDAVAFAGGLDLTIRRWDTPAHDPAEARRADPAGQPYGPYHDVQMVVDGEAAKALGEIVRERWRDATDRRLPPATTAGDPWPDSVSPDLRDVPVGIARTVPGMFEAPEVREVEALYLRAIGAAERFIYIENQYLTAMRIAEALIARLEACDRLEVLILGPRRAEGFFEARSMGMGRQRFLDRLRESGVGDRVRVLYAIRTADGREAPVFIHAKLMIVDDRLLNVGSANLNNRSMGVDTECNLAVEARSESQRRAIAGIRDRLIAEHTGADAEDVARALAGGAAIRGLESLVSHGHALEPVEEEEVPSEEVAALSRHLADPDVPLESSEPARGLYGAAMLTASWRQRLLLTGLALVLLTAFLAWNAGPVSEVADPDRLRPLLLDMHGSAWTPLLVLALYLVAGAVMFPVTVLIVATSVTFGPWWGFVYALAGCLLSAALTFEVGALVGRSGLRRLMGRRLNRISRTLARQGVASVAIIRVLPLAPFTFINLVAGVSHIRHKDYFLGTVLGMTPGLVIMSAMGAALRRVWEHPDIVGIAGVVGALGAWFAFGILVQRFVTGRRRVVSD